MLISGKRLTGDVHCKKRDPIKAKLTRRRNEFRHAANVIALKCATGYNPRPLMGSLFEQIETSLQSNESINTPDFLIRVRVRSIERNIEFINCFEGSCLTRVQQQPVRNDAHFSGYFFELADRVGKSWVDNRLSSGQQDLSRPPAGKSLVQLIEQSVRHLTLAGYL